MKKLLVVALLLVTCPAFAAIQYEFFQKSSADVSGLPPADMSGRTTVDGVRSRIDFVSGNVYQPGTYMIVNDPSHAVFVDPLSKTYTEINTSGLASAFGSPNILIENLASSVDRLADHPTVASQPTDHYRLTLTYDITLNFRGIPLKQNVRTVIDKWTTLAFGEVTPAGSDSPQTGNPKVDELIAAETTKIKGFAMKQTVSITTTNVRKATTQSELKLPSTRTQTREMEITTIRQLASVDPLTFTIPASFKRNEGDPATAETPSKVLTFDPPSK